MNWQDILKGRKGKGISVEAKKLIDKVMTTTPKPINTILDDMYNQMEIEKKRGNEINISGKKTIPTRWELRAYLDTNYSKVKISRKTNKPVISQGIVHYYKEE